MAPKSNRESHTTTSTFSQGQIEKYSFRNVVILLLFYNNNSFLKGGVCKVEVFERKMVRSKHGYPPKQGLYSPEFEREACGVGFVAKINGEKSRKVKEILIILIDASLIISRFVEPRLWNLQGVHSFEKATFHFESIKM